GRLRWPQFGGPKRSRVGISWCTSAVTKYEGYSVHPFDAPGAEEFTGLTRPGSNLARPAHPRTGSVAFRGTVGSAMPWRPTCQIARASLVTPRRPAAGARHRWRVRSAAAKVLHEREPGDDHLRGAVGTQTAHRSQPLSKVTVIGFDPVVCVLFDVVPGRRDQFLEDPRVDGCGVGDDLGRCHLHRGQRTPEEPAGGLPGSAGRHVHVDDLPVLVNG